MALIDQIYFSALGAEIKILRQQAWDNRSGDDG
jgi:hypothetical protein